MSTVEILTLALAVFTAAGALWGHLKSARKDELEILRGIIDELEGKCDRLTAENNELKVQLGGLLARMRELEEENQQMKARIEELVEENNCLKQLTAKATSSKSKSKNRVAIEG